MESGLLTFKGLPSDDSRLPSTPFANQMRLGATQEQSSKTSSLPHVSNLTALGLSQDLQTCSLCDFLSWNSVV